MAAREGIRGARTRAVQWQRLDRRWLAPLLAAIIGWWAILALSYAGGYRQQLDVGSQPVPIGGLYQSEHNNQFTYAFTAGRALMRFPWVGRGFFRLDLRIGGPSTPKPVEASLVTADGPTALGPVTQPRDYHLLLPPETDGDPAAALTSTTTQPSGESRRLGAFIDELELQALTPVLPPIDLMWSAPLTVFALWATVLQLDTTNRRKLWLFALGFGVLCLLLIASRGRVIIQSWQLLAGGLVLAGATTASRLDSRRAGSALRAVTPIFVLWHVAVFGAAMVAVRYAATIKPWLDRISYGGGDFSVPRTGSWLWNALVGGWVQWDGYHYQRIVTHGYALHGEWPTIAFFPLYPLLVRLIMPITGSFAVAAVLVSHVALFAALLLLYDLLVCDWSRPVALRTIVLLLLFPMAAYFAAAYTESLALLLLVATIWAARREHWWLAGLCGLLLALTRLPGVLIAPVLAIEYMQRRGWRAIRADALAFTLPPLGLLGFMAYQWRAFGTPFAFMDAQRSWNQYLSPPWLIPQTMIGWLANGISWDLTLPIVQLVCWIIGLALLVLALRRLPLIYGLSALLMLLPAYLSNKSQSLPRYLLLAFPLFVVVALRADRRGVRQVLYLALLPMLLVATMLFVTSFWLS